jgi:hypothetical protein
MNPPDDSPCWAGEWTTVAPMVDLWAHSALVRTVAALPTLHAWRLGDDKGSRRSLLWCATPMPDSTDAPDGNGHGVAVLSQSAPPPSLGLGDVDGQGDLLAGPVVRASSSMTEGLLFTLATELSRTAADAIADAVGGRSQSQSQVAEAPSEAGMSPYRPTDSGVRRWVGGIAQLPGAWLPELAILPTSRRDIDDPGTRWGTESVAFAARHTVHAVDTKFASDVLAPHVTALILDQVPDDAAVTVAGDALHVWWEYTEPSSAATARASRTVEIACRLRDALPTFVLGDYPDHSHRVEERLAERAARAAAYRAARKTGRHKDPTLQQIYATAQAEYEAGRQKD